MVWRRHHSTLTMTVLASLSRSQVAQFVVNLSPALVDPDSTRMRTVLTRMQHTSQARLQLEFWHRSQIQPSSGTQWQEDTQKALEKEGTGLRPPAPTRVDLTAYGRLKLPSRRWQWSALSPPPLRA